MGRQANPLEHRLRQRPRLRSAMHACRGEPQIFTHRQAVEDAWHLRFDAHAAPRDRGNSAPVTSSPPHKTAPDVGLSWPVNILKNVLLRAPLGPIKTTQLAFSEREVDIADRMHAAEAHGRALGFRSAVTGHPRHSRGGSGRRSEGKGRQLSAQGPSGTSRTKAIRMAPRMKGNVAEQGLPAGVPARRIRAQGGGQPLDPDASEDRTNQRPRAHDNNPDDNLGRLREAKDGWAYEGAPVGEQAPRNSPRARLRS